MQEQLKVLEDLQQLDAQLQETEDTLSSLPAKLKALKNDVGRVEALLEKERAQLAEVVHYKEDLDASLKVDQEQLQKTKSKINQVRTSKEYMANQRELEASRKSTGEREEELLKLLEAIDQFQKSIKVHEDELAALKAHVVEEEQETAIKISALENKRKDQIVARDHKATEVRKDMLAKYETIRRRRGHAIVPVRNGVCTGCNMHLPPQLFNILQRRTTIEHCPSCQRIIYFVDHAEEIKE